MSLYKHRLDSSHDSISPTATSTSNRTNSVTIPIQDSQQSAIPSVSSSNAIHHHSTQSTTASDYYQQLQAQPQQYHGQAPAYGSSLSSQQSGSMASSSSITQQSAMIHNSVPVSSATQFYAPYGQYNPMPATQPNLHYSTARGSYEQTLPPYQSNPVLSPQLSQQSQPPTTQSQWQQQYYR